MIEYLYKKNKTIESYTDFVIAHQGMQLCEDDEKFWFEKSTEYVLTNEDKISKLKQELLSMDYKTSKYVDGEYTESEWAEIILQRKAIRDKIKELEI